MNLRSWWNKARLANSPLPQYHHLDHKLINRLRGKITPNWRQFKYLNKFLSPKEKRLLLSLIIAVGSATLLWAIIFVASHITFGPKAGGDYSEALIGQPKYLNPLFAGANDVDSDLTSLIYGGLFTFDSSGSPTPNLAAAYQVSADEKTYDISLKHDTRWSDGEPFTANDVIFTFDLIQNPEVGSPLYAAFLGVKLDKLDDYHIRFTLKEPFAPFLSSLAVGILPEHIWSQIQPVNFRLAKYNLQPIGSGPFAFNKLTKDDTGSIQSLILRQNQYYFQTKPYLQTLTFKFFGDYDQALDALRGQTVQAITFIPKFNTQKLGSKNINIYSLTLPQYTALFFNSQKQSVLKNDSLRQALALAIDKNRLIKNGLDGAGEAIDSPILPGILEYSPPAKRYNYNLTEANSLFDKDWPKIQPEEYFNIRRKEAAGNLPASATTSAGNNSAREAELNQSIRQEMDPKQIFYRKNKDGQILTLTITSVDTPEYKKISDLLVNFWSALGIKTNVRLINSHQIMREAIRPRNYEILLYGEILGSEPDLFPFWHSSQADFPGLNLSHYANAEVDKILEQARQTADSKKRADLFAKLQTRLINDLPAIFLYTPRYSFLASKELRGINLNTILSPADRYRNINEWYLKTSWQWGP